MTSATPLPGVEFRFSDVFQGETSDEVFFSNPEWIHPVSFFVGRNGSGKSRVAKLVADHLGARRLSTDRLSGLMLYDNYGHSSAPNVQGFRGIPLDDSQRNSALQVSRQHGTGIEEMYALKEEPEVWLRVAAFIRRVLGRVIDLRENAGFLDPFVRMGSAEYSLLREEGHGLRELVILLTAIYRSDWRFLIIDEPELHLHPAMVRLWLAELERVCSSKERQAVVVTHEPSLLRPKTATDLSAVFFFSAGKKAIPMSEAVRPDDADRITATLKANPEIVSQLVFSPRPVLVEGTHDVAALTIALGRTQPSEVVAQTDLINCTGSGAVALWFEVSDTLGIDVRAVADLDACMDRGVQRVMDRSAAIQELYKSELLAEPPTTSTVLKTLLEAMNSDGIEKNSKERAKWLAQPHPYTGWEWRISKLINSWKNVGFWLHKQGTLEDVLGITGDKGIEKAQAAAENPGPIDDVARWCAYELDTSGEVSGLLGVAVERIAHAIMEAQRSEPGSEYRSPIGGPNSSDARLVQLQPIGEGKHRLTVLRPDEFAGYWLEFSRETPANQLQLKKPDNSESEQGPRT